MGYCRQLRCIKKRTSDHRLRSADSGCTLACRFQSDYYSDRGIYRLVRHSIGNKQLYLRYPSPFCSAPPQNIVRWTYLAILIPFPVFKLFVSYRRNLRNTPLELSQLFRISLHQVGEFEHYYPSASYRMTKIDPQAALSVA